MLKFFKMRDKFSTLTFDNVIFVAIMFIILLKEFCLRVCGTTFGFRVSIKLNWIFIDYFVDL